MCLAVPFCELEAGQGRADLAVLRTLLQECWRGQGGHRRSEVSRARSPLLEGSEQQDVEGGTVTSGPRAERMAALWQGQIHRHPH